MKHFFFFIFLTTFHCAFAQSFWFGAKGGGAMNFQSWGNARFGSLSGNPLFSLNGDIFIESFDELKQGALYAQLGFHTRGSSIRFFSLNNTFTANQGFQYKNIVLELGAKKSFNLLKEFDPYFILGIRGEYTVGTNLNDYLSFGSLFYPVNDFVRKVVAGVTIGGGFELPMSDMSNVFLEFSLQPDALPQYDQPPLFNVIDPWTRQPITIEQSLVRNLSIEAKVGIKFLRKVIYE